MTSYAIIEIGGKQLRVEPGRFYDVNRIAAEESETVTIDKVLFIQNEGEISIGQPLIDGATIETTVLRHLRGPKIIVYKMQPKKKTRKKRGHRQELTRLMVESITLGDIKIGVAAAEPAVEVADPAEVAEPIEAVEAAETE